MKTWKTLVLAALFSLLFASVWRPGIALAAVDTPIVFVGPDGKWLDPPPAPKKAKSSPRVVPAKATTGGPTTGPTAGSNGSSHHK
jgi:hypothetical protein